MSTFLLRVFCASLRKLQAQRFRHPPWHHNRRLGRRQPYPPIRINRIKFVVPCVASGVPAITPTMSPFFTSFSSNRRFSADAARVSISYERSILRGNTFQYSAIFRRVSRSGEKPMIGVRGRYFDTSAAAPPLSEKPALPFT